MKNKLRYIPILTIIPILSFGISLKDVYSFTLQNDESIKTNYYDTESRKQDLDIQKARLYPNISSTLTKSNRSYLTNTEIQRTEKENYNSLEFSLSQSIYDGSIYSSIKEAKYDMKLQEILLEEKKQETALSAIDVFIDGLISKSLIETTKKELKYYETKRLQFEKMYKLNLLAKNQLDKSKLDYNDIYIKLNEYKNDLKLEKLKLHHFMNKKVDSLEEVKDIESYDVNYEFDKLLLDNLKLKGGKVGINLVKQRVETSKTGHYPVLALRANYTKYDSNNYIDDYETDKRILFELKIPLYEGGGTNAKIEQNRLSYEASKMDFIDKIEQTKNEYEELMLLKEIQVEKIEIYSSAIKDTEIYYNSILKSFEKNLKNRVDLAEVEFMFAEKKHKIIEAKYEKLRINLRLKFLAGNLNLAL
ncbi:TolC family protein [Poseidonibacter antarcticus]|uniref:TolC family protein n=1 Tax=Poseidonibacter antarcticus TaxID=2478538 RepID=UPI000EF4AB90|nr:TolC family protein [Poseidonibacter antarcticus]